MAHENLKNKKTVVVKSKLNILAYRPEVQQTGMTSVYKTRQNSHFNIKIYLVSFG